MMEFIEPTARESWKSIALKEGSARFLTGSFERISSRSSARAKALSPRMKSPVQSSPN